MSTAPRATGGCLCGALRYEVRGALRDVLLCHCRECRRWHGHVAAFTAAARDDVHLVEDGGLRWFADAPSETRARRGFCARCGASVLWEAPDRETIGIAAGSLDSPTGLSTTGHIYVSEAGDYYELADDRLPRHERGVPSRR
jgi:hypothetical protein